MISPPIHSSGTCSADTSDSSRFIEKETTAETWLETLLPALARVVEAIRQHAPGRDVEAFGLPTLPAALAFGLPVHQRLTRIVAANHSGTPGSTLDTR
jgi:hypothetical protein